MDILSVHCSGCAYIIRLFFRRQKKIVCTSRLASGAKTVCSLLFSIFAAIGSKWLTTSVLFLSVLRESLKRGMTCGMGQDDCA